MEKKKVIVELTVLTQRMTDREIERDIDKLVLPLRGLEAGQTAIDYVEIIDVKH